MEEKDFEKMQYLFYKPYIKQLDKLLLKLIINYILNIANSFNLYIMVKCKTRKFPQVQNSI